MNEVESVPAILGKPAFFPERAKVQSDRTSTNMAFLSSSEKDSVCNNSTSLLHMRFHYYITRTDGR